MTGNTKVWRAPLAGLASLAMLATMGVAAGTASAATVNAKDANTVSVKVNGVAVKYRGNDLPKGVTYADVLALSGENLGKTLLNASEGTTTFGGYSDGDGYVDLNAQAKDGAELKPISVTDGVRFKFQKEDGTFLGAVNVPRNAGGQSVTYPKALALNDAADDGEILGAMTYKYDDAQSTTGEFAYGDTLDLNASVKDVTVTVKTTAAWTFNYNAQSESGYKVTYPGEFADGQNNETLTVEVPAPATGVTNVDPSAVEAALHINLTGDQSYGIDGWEQNDGKSFDSKSPVNADGWTITPQVKKAHTVKFVVNGETWKTQSVVDGHKASFVKYEPTDGSSFLGWSETKDSKKADFKFDTAITVDKTLYAVFVAGGNYTVTYKFNDGKTEDKTVTYLANQVVARPDDPTRDGYVFGGWYKDNGDGVFNTTKDEEFTGFGVAANENTVLFARWLKANDATLKAAFKYVDGSDVTNNADKGQYKGLFTDASFKEYVKTYQAVQAEYAKAQNDATAAGKPIDDATFAKLLDELVAGWKKLEFVHTGELANGNTIVHRLSKGNDHFYTQDAKELKALTNNNFTGAWNDEGELFQAVPKADTEVRYAGLKSFDKVAGADADVLATLNAVADPILTPVTRLYNRVNGDHVWSVDQNEVDFLSSQAAWNNEATAFYVPRYTGSQPVTRLAKGARHLLSTDANEVKVLSAAGWTNEGTAFKAY